jgi:hypothetical protein
MIKKERIVVIVIALGMLLAILGFLSILGIIDLIILLQGVLAFVAEHWIGAVIFLFGGIGLLVIKMIFDWWKKRQQEEMKLTRFLDELNHNKKKTVKEDRNSYQFSAYDEVKKSAHFLNLSYNLREKIYDAYDIIKSFHENPKNVHFQKRIPELQELLEDIIPEFAEYLKSCGVKK